MCDQNFTKHYFIWAWLNPITTISFLLCYFRYETKLTEFESWDFISQNLNNKYSFDALVWQIIVVSFVQVTAII